MKVLVQAVFFYAYRDVYKRQPLPRYFWMVFALAGDSTITSFGAAAFLVVAAFFLVVVFFAAVVVFFAAVFFVVSFLAVSYTHLDVYKRQTLHHPKIPDVRCTLTDVSPRLRRKSGSVRLPKKPEDVYKRQVFACSKDVILFSPLL